MKKLFVSAVIAVLALTASINANAQDFASEATPVEIAATLTPDAAYVYTVLCQKFISESAQIENSERLSENQKQNRKAVLVGIYLDQFSQFLDSDRTFATIRALSK